MLRIRLQRMRNSGALMREPMGSSKSPLQGMLPQVLPQRGGRAH